MPRTTNPNVFVNCPFDEAFQPLFKSIIFTTLYLDYNPVFSNTTSSESIRVKNIMRLIAKSNFGIHDLSRNESGKRGEKARFNMPFELGLDIGSKRFGGPKFAGKKILILDSKPHDYDQYIGDISGQDIESHANDPETLIKVIRDWFSRIYPKKRFIGASKIWKAFNQFSDDLPLQLSGAFNKREIDNLQMSDYKEYAADWIQEMKLHR